MIFLPFQVQVGPPSCSCSWSWARVIFGSWLFANPTASFDPAGAPAFAPSSILVTLHYFGQILPSSTYSVLPSSPQQTRFIIQAPKHDPLSVKPRLQYCSHFSQWLRSRLRRKASRPAHINNRSLPMVSKPLRFAPPHGFHGYWHQTPTPTCGCVVCLHAIFNQPQATSVCHISHAACSNHSSCLTR